jgi:glycosyltransferase involved in cell wall biosynthesis
MIASAASVAAKKSAKPGRVGIFAMSANLNPLRLKTRGVPADAQSVPECVVSREFGCWGVCSSRSAIENEMNIAYVTADADVPVFGKKGCSVHVQEMLRAFMRRGMEADVFAGAFGGSVTAEFSGLRMPSIRQQKTDDPEDHEQAAVAANTVLREVLANRNFEQPFSLVYERYSLWSYAAMEFAREQSIPAVLEMNAPLLEENTRRHLLIDRAKAEDATMRAFRAATVITTVSRQLAHIVEKHPSARGKVHVIPNASDPNRFSSATPSLTRTPDQFVVGFVGELQAWQGVSVLLSAFQLVADALPHSKLIIIGDGPEREPLERDVAAKGLQNHVVFTGAVSPHSIPGMLASLDVAVAPYPQLAGFYKSPLKIFEYMAAGLPIVASRIAQVQETLTHNRTGILVSPGDKESLAQALYDLHEDRDKRLQLGTAARARARSCHTWDGALAEILHRAGFRQLLPA